MEDNEFEKGDIHKQHNMKLSDVMTSTQDQRVKLESEFAKQARSTNRIVQELEVRVKQLTEEVANEAKVSRHFQRCHVVVVVVVYRIEHVSSKRKQIWSRKFNLSDTN